MEEVRQLVQEEGREARNLVAFHVAVETAAPSSSRVSRKPPRVSTVHRGVPRSATRLRSASTGRDKRSELRARYWALLFGDLQRAIGEIYNTVEAHENQNECQEVMLVLENYTRDFKALGEWFRLKWEYDNTPPPQRPQSLAWEIRKTDFVRPESRRAYSVRSSPSVSGKNSPSLSGHNTPSGKNSPVTGKASPGSGKISPRVAGYSQTSPKANIEFFSNKIASIIATMPEAKVVKETRLSDIKEKDVKESCDDADVDNDLNVEVKQPTVELGKAKECQNICPKQVVIKSPKHVKPNTEKNEEISSQAKAITAKIDAMESEFLEKQLLENNVKNENVLNKDRELEKLENESKDNLNEVDKASKDTDGKDTRASASPVKSEENFGDVSNDSSPDTNKPKDIDKAKDQTNTTEINSEITVKTAKALTEIIIKDISLYNKDNVKPTTEVIDAKEFDQKNDIEKDSKFFKPIDPKLPEIKPSARPAYSQAAAKPKIVVAKPEAKPPVRMTAQIVRSKTVVEIPRNAPKARQQFPKRSQTSKCSYPFNLTTGRSSLFDTTPAKVVVKKPMPRAMSSGDNKTGQPKVETKKYPPRPTSLKINEKGDKTETSSASLAKIRDCDEYSSSDTLVTQIDMSRIESSESLKTLVPEEVQTIPDGANSVEVLNVELKSDDEEWLTVTSKRFNREKKQSNWANRFHQPSATTSLPTLNMMESPKQENNTIINSNNDRAKSEQPEKPKPLKVKLTKPKEKTRDLAMIRQKSDVTGLKTRSARNKVQKKSERAKDMQRKGGDLTKSRLHSSLESLTIGLARSQESTEEVFDFDKWKAEFKSTFKCFDDDDQISNHNEILKAADPSEMSEIAGITSQIEENERKMSLALDFQSDADQRKLCAEEDLLNRQILELQQVSDIDLDTETDDTETDAEICTDAEVCEDSSMSVASCPFPENLCSLAASLDDRYENAFSGMSWSERIDMLVVLEALMARDPEACLDDRNENAFSGMSRSERVDMLVVLEALMARDPGRAQQLHAKLSQGIKRRGSLQDTLRRLQAKQARAEKQRLEYQMERANRIHVLLGRVEEVKVAKNQLIEAKRIRLEKRLQRAAENRDQHLKDIVRKAHDEEEKLREIAFIKQLEAENRRHDFLDQCRVHTARLRLMRRDRLNKLEQKAAREAAVGARRQAIEAARKLHVESLLERRKERDARVEGLKEQKKQERDDAAREKAEGVKSRLSALAAAAELEADALRSRIRDKQDASQMRLESHLQAIREKATGPRQPTTSESQDQSAREEREMQEEAARLEAERKEREKQRAIKKKARKVKQKLLTTGCDNAFTDATIPVDAIFPGSAKMHKIIQQLSNILNPLIPKSDTNGVNNEVENASKKNKNKNNNKVPNGNGNNNENEVNGAGNQQKLKKQNSEETEFENAAANVIENNNNNDKDVLSENNATGEPKNENKKKAKKNKNNKEMENKNDKPKLSQTSSVCSSLSDMSRTSQRNDNRAKVVIDMTYLERQLNELYRLTDKFSKFTKDKCVAQKLQILRILGLLFAVIAEREDLAPEFATKTISTAVMMVSQLISKCPMSAAFFITTNHATHAVKMLAERLEKDLPSEPRESELVRYLADCLSIAFDSVICSTRLYEKTRNRELELDLLSSLRGRVHTLISYLCLCGCVTRAETAGTARESVHTLLTLCSDLCLHCDVDDGPERASAMQSLRCALGTSLCGARADLCKLFAQRSSDLQRCSGFVRAARTAHLLRAVAELDHHIVQESFGEGGWPLEFRAAVARLLTHHAPNDRESPRNTTSPGVTDIRLDQRLSETMVLDLIVLVGFVVVNNPQLQETICDGWSVIKTLCTLPANWLVSKPNCHALLPTLVALSEHPGANKIICADLSSQMLEEYMESPDAQTGKLVLLIKQGRAKKSGKK